VDYHNSSHSALRSASWRDQIRTNYALYGIDVAFVIDDSISPF